MKKLFLYIALAFLLFFIAYLVSFEFFQKNTHEINKISYNVTESPVENSTDSTSEYEIEYYVVTMSDGYVIVKDEDDRIYDYTDIEISLLPDDTVSNLKRGIYFYDIMQMYNYLESLSS